MSNCVSELALSRGKQTFIFMTRDGFATWNKAPTLPQKLGDQDAAIFLDYIPREGSQVPEKLIILTKGLSLLTDMCTLQREERVLRMISFLKYVL